MAGFEEWIKTVLADYGLLAIFVTMALESACIPIPSEIVVPFGGFMAAQGEFPLWAVVVVATLANLVGSGIAYALGRYGGRAFFLRYGRYVFVSAHHLDKAEEWFDRRGEITVFLTRMMPGVRTFISVPAGIARMDLGRFFLYSFLGALPWNLALALLGYAFGENWDRLQALFGEFNRVFYVLLALFFVAVGAWWWRKSRRARARREQSG
jgi:membrane protein DedA with SNARE-associated domain